MKKASLILNLLLVLVIASSCSSSKQARGYKKTIDGNWQLQTIVTEGITGKVKVMLFDEADFNCFVGSTWTFNNYNGLGTYTINNTGECASVKRNIRWTIYEAPNEPKLFQFKRLNEKLKDLDDGAGFRFSVVQVESNTMQLRSSITFEGKPASFIYNFIRN
jgi:hypothetical protein